MSLQVHFLQVGMSNKSEHIQKEATGNIPAAQVQFLLV